MSESKKEQELETIEFELNMMSADVFVDTFKETIDEKLMYCHEIGLYDVAYVKKYAMENQLDELIGAY